MRESVTRVVLAVRAMNVDIWHWCIRKHLILPLPFQFLLSEEKTEEYRNVSNLIRFYSCKKKKPCSLPGWLCLPVSKMRDNSTSMSPSENLWREMMRRLPTHPTLHGVKWLKRKLSRQWDMHLLISFRCIRRPGW